MKSIHFENLHTKRYYVLLLVINAVILIYFIATAGNGKCAKELFFITLLFSFIGLGRKLWFKTYVHCTSRRILTRINSTSQINIIFDNLTDIEYAKDKLILTENTKTHKIDIEDVNPNDVQKLINLMIQRSEAFYKDSSHLKYYE